ncbi:hypothetical protein MJD09_18025 [bacterium]|nr:hypothetical protein [bacterium]
MRDFTLSAYDWLLRAYQEHGYQLCSYEGYLTQQNENQRVVILRHDVDKRPINSLRTAQLEHRCSASGTYYFRVVNASFDEAIIRQIADLGHEIGYHYEDLSLCKGDFPKAIEHFEGSLERLRRLYPVKTICMHGSPLSRWDNRLLWKEYNYQDFGILAEPYLDMDFHKACYLTDTGRRWNGVDADVSIRDTVSSSFKMNLRSTVDIISALETSRLPDVVMQNIHPQRWSDGYAEWIMELTTQNMKNMIKKLLIRLIRATRS